VVSGESKDKSFHTRVHCRDQGLVTIVVNVPTSQVDVLGFLFTAMSNSFSLKPFLNPQAKPAPHIDLPSFAPGYAVSSIATPVPPPSAVGVDRLGKTSAIKLALRDGADLRPQDVLERVCLPKTTSGSIDDEVRRGSPSACSSARYGRKCWVAGRVLPLNRLTRAESACFSP
jgi:hypothetical protein